MAIRQTIQTGHPNLKAINKKIVNFSNPELSQLIADLKDTMYEVGLIGIAAPQIGENFMVFITEPRKTDTRPADQTDEFRVYINPKIVWSSKEQIEIWEGCGSVCDAKLFGSVFRPKVIEVEAFDLQNRKFGFKCDGILGRVIQHEMDHLLGVEFIEKIADYSKLKSLDFYIKDIKNSPELLKATNITIKEFKLL